MTAALITAPFLASALVLLLGIVRALRRGWR